MQEGKNVTIHFTAQGHITKTDESDMWRAEWYFLNGFTIKGNLCRPSTPYQESCCVSGVGNIITDVGKNY